MIKTLILVAGLLAALLPTQLMAQGHSLAAGWSIVGNDSGRDVNPVAVFGNATTPTSISAAVTSIWTWDTAQAKWAFFAPSLTASELTAYAASKGYGVMVAIEKGAGFWVNSRTATTVNFAATSIPAYCTLGNINAASYSAIQVGMTYDQVTQTIGCLNDTSLTTRMSGMVQYVWSLNAGSLMTSILVYFDGTGTIVTPFGGSFKSSFGI